MIDDTVGTKINGKNKKQKSKADEVTGGVTSNVLILVLRRLFKHTILVTASTIGILIFRTESAIFSLFFLFWYATESDKTEKPTAAV